MPSAYASLNINVRRFLDDKVARKWSVSDIGMLLNEGAQFFQNETKLLKNRTTISGVANQAMYNMAEACMEPVEIDFCSGGSWYKVAGENPAQFNCHKTPVYGDRPYAYTFLDDERILKLWPCPNTAAPASTLNGGINASVTTITVVSTSNFPDQGRAIIDSEVVEWTAKTDTTLTGVIRGAEDTTASTHLTGATITLRDIRIYGVRRLLAREMRTYYSTGTVGITSGTTALTGTSTEWVTGGIQAGDLFAYTSDATSVDPEKWYTIATVTDKTNIVLSSAYGEATLSGSSYLISDPSPFPTEYDGFLRAYALSKALDKAGDFDGARKQWAMLMQYLTNAKSRMVKVDTALYPHGRHDYNVRGRMNTGTLGSHYGGY